MTLTPEQELVARLAGQPGAGTFEAHVTIQAADRAERERFRAVCAELGVKCVLIELPQGETRSQPMTATYHHGELASVVREVAALAADLRARRFVVSRVKLEAVITNSGVPATDDEARRSPAANYFELHVKVALPGIEAMEALRALCGAHGAHLSRNALQSDEGRRFVTLRVYGLGRQSAEARFDALLAGIDALGLAWSNKLREYTLFDSNAAVDAGWIDAPGAGP